MKIFLLMLFIAHVNAAEVQPRGSVSVVDLIQVNSWAKIVSCNSVRLDCKDQWMGGSAFGVRFLKDAEGLKLKQSQIAGITKFFLNSKSISAKSLEPWDGSDQQYYVVLNEKNRAIYTITTKNDRNWLKIQQVIQLVPGEARFSFGDENFLYLEVESNDIFPLPQ